MIKEILGQRNITNGGFDVERKRGSVAAMLKIASRNCLGGVVRVRLKALSEFGITDPEGDIFQQIVDSCLVVREIAEEIAERIKGAIKSGGYGVVMNRAFAQRTRRNSNSLVDRYAFGEEAVVSFRTACFLIGCEPHSFLFQEVGTALPSLTSFAGGMPNPGDLKGLEAVHAKLAGEFTAELAKVQASSDAKIAQLLALVQAQGVDTSSITAPSVGTPALPKPKTGRKPQSEETKAKARAKKAANKAAKEAAKQAALDADDAGDADGAGEAE